MCENFFWVENLTAEKNNSSLMHRRLPSLIYAVKGSIEQFGQIQKVAHTKLAIFAFISKTYNVL